MNWLRSSLRVWLGMMGHDAELVNQVERLHHRVGDLEIGLDWLTKNRGLDNESFNQRVAALENKPAVSVAKRKAGK